MRWKIETAYLELNPASWAAGCYAHRPAGIAQELYALLTTYQILRIASFTVALQTARDQLTQAAGVIADTMIDLVGTIGHRVLTNLLPNRRLRITPRVVKRAISKYQARGPNINQLPSHPQHQHPHPTRPLTPATIA